MCLLNKLFNWGMEPKTNNSMQDSGGLCAQLQDKISIYFVMWGLFQEHVGKCPLPTKNDSNIPNWRLKLRIFFERLALHITLVPKLIFMEANFMFFFYSSCDMLHFPVSIQAPCLLSFSQNDGGYATAIKRYFCEYKHQSYLVYFNFILLATIYRVLWFCQRCIIMVDDDKNSLF